MTRGLERLAKRRGRQNTASRQPIRRPDDGVSFHKPFFALTAALASLSVLAAPASAQALGAPASASSTLNLSAKTVGALKRGGVSIVPTGPATARSASTLVLAYSWAQWDFAARKGAVAGDDAGFRLRRADGRSVAVTHPRVVLDGARGYVTARIANVPVKLFTLQRRDARVLDTPAAPELTGVGVTLTKASALLIDRGLGRRTFPAAVQFGVLRLRVRRPTLAAAPTAGGDAPATGAAAAVPVAPVLPDSSPPEATMAFGTLIASVLPAGGELTADAAAVGLDSDGDGLDDVNALGLPLKANTFDSATGAGTITFDGGVVVQVAGHVVSLSDPEIVLDATQGASAVFLRINGVRVRIGDIDATALRVDVADATVKLSGLAVHASAAAAALAARFGVTLTSQPVRLSVSVPRR